MKTTLTVDAEYLKVMKDLTKEHGVETQQEYFNAMVTYFKETGINPKEKTRSTADELSKLRNTVISFIREQEKKKLDPIILKVTEVMEFLKEYFQKDAVSKEDIENLLRQVKVQKEVKEPLPLPPGEEDEKLKKQTTYVKSVFNEFLSSFKPSAFGGYTIDKAVMERYKSIFSKL